MAASVLYNRMQNLHISGNCDNNKFYHYCYVCNTQLNSCKQALLHCSGKRHRKKLQFLQNRKGGHFGGAVTQLAPDAFQTPPNGAPPPPPGAHIASLAPVPPQALVGANAPAGATGPTLVAAIPGAPAPPPGHVQTVPNAAAAPHGCYYPIMTPMEHWVTPTATAPPAFVHFHGQFGAVHTSHLFRQQTAPAHLPAGQHLAPRPLRPGFVTNGPHMPPRPLLRYHESFASTGSNSPIMLTDMSAFGSGSSTGTRSAVISPSETSSISSESLISPKTRLLYRCYVCQRQFVTNMQLQVHLQTSRHYKQYLMQAGSHLERTGDSSETDSWVSSPSIYYCMVCNIAVNSPAQLEAHTASHKHKLRLPVPGTNVAPRTHSRSSSTSSETPVELIMDSGYVSGSGDELICISHPTPDKPTAKFRCQICNIFLNSPAQAKQHLNSQKHTQRFSSLRPQFRRKSSSSFKRKQSASEQQVQKQASETSSLTEVIAEGEDCASLSAATRSLDTPSPDQEHDLEEESLDDNEDDKATMVRCHSL